MSRANRLRVFRAQLSLIVKIVTLIAVTGFAIAVPAYAAGAHSSAPGPARPAADARPGLALYGPGLIAPLTGISPRTAAQAATASSTCVRYATRAGWANNGYFAGDLVTAAAICAAESAGDPKLYVCVNAAGKAVGHGDFVQGQPVKCTEGTEAYDPSHCQMDTDD